MPDGGAREEFLTADYLSDRVLSEPVDGEVGVKLAHLVGNCDVPLGMTETDRRGDVEGAAPARSGTLPGLAAAADRFAAKFEQALKQHADTPDAFETARTQLAYGARLRRTRNRKLAREHLRGALATFELLDARPWIDSALAELVASVLAAVSIWGIVQVTTQPRRRRPLLRR
jgi:hypothetical protein